MIAVFQRFRRPAATLATVAAASLTFGFASVAGASYESPNFDRAPFDVDALSLDENARDEIVKALAALALNFSGDERVDDDLREKALGVALSLDPLDGTARSAHAALLRGAKPTPVDFFSDLNSIVRALWRHGEKLADPGAEPEDHKLAPYLMEIALVLKSGPEPDEIWLFGHTAGFKEVGWHSLVSLQGSAYDSNINAQRLLREARELRKSTGTRPRPGTGPASRPPHNTGSGSSVAEIKLPQPVVRLAAHDPESGAIPGEAKLDVRKPTDDERGLYGLFLGSNGADKESFLMRLAWDRDGPTITGYETAEEWIKKTYPRWPKNLVGELSFKAAGTNQPSQVELSFPCALLLESAFSGAATLPDVAVAGFLDEEGTVSLPGNAADHARAAGIGGGAVVKVLLMPSAAETGLVDAVTGGNLSVLVRPQVIGFTAYSEAKTLALGPRPEKLAEAIQMFDEIQNLTSQGMSLDEIAKNTAVHERLRAIMALWPGHLSAKIMLAYGTQPVDMHLSQEGSVGQIDTALKPVAKHYTDSVFGGGTVVGAAEKLVDQARITLRELRPKIHADARGCLNSAERTLDAFDAYFSLTNKSSSRAAQLRRELQEAVNELNAARTRLGASDNIAL